jgi:dipeptide/tripeptide permease
MRRREALMSTVRFVVLMLAFPALVALERTAHYAVRAQLTLFMTGPASEGGLAMTMEEVATSYAIRTTLTALAPLLGGLVAIATGPRITMVAGALLVTISYVVQAAASQTTILVAMVVWAVGHGLLLPSLYAVVAREFSGQREAFKIVPFVLIYIAVNVGAMIAPVLAGSIRDLGASFSAICVGAAVIMTIVLAALTTVGLLGAKQQPPSSKGKVELGLLIVLVAVSPALVIHSLGFDLIFRAASTVVSAGLPEVLFMINPAVVLLVTLGLAVAMLVLGALKKRPYTLVVIGAGIVVTAFSALPMLLADLATSLPAQLASVAVLAMGEALVLALTMARMATGTHARFATLVLAVWFCVSRGIFSLGSAVSDAGFGKPLLIAAAIGCVLTGAALLALGPALRRRLFAPEAANDAAHGRRRAGCGRRAH